MRRPFLLCAAALAGSLAAGGQDLAFTISMPQPGNHTFHVVARASGLDGEVTDFKMPVWMPGYYRILDYAGNVSNFAARHASGRALGWEKVARNTWRVVNAGAEAITLEYDVTGSVRFAAQNYLAEDRAHIAPPGMFVHVANRLRRPATVTVQPPQGWRTVATGLDPVEGRPNTYFAADFDVLYDAPLLLGNQELLRFDVQDVPHFVAIEDVPASVGRAKLLADLKRMVEAATGLIGDIPYRHYTFLLMGRGNGGIEHLNSASIAFNGESLTSADGYRGWLSYVAHEYFHHFNVKRIRPIALGPFDYDRENLTNMLWVSEGLSVYYQDLVCLRAGLITRDQYLAKMSASIQRFENLPGHRYQSAVESSWSTWGTSGVGNDRNTSISYYDNGAMLGAMLDLEIRRATGGGKSLDDVMRALYRKYYRDRQRGFTDAEFRAECEAAADRPLAAVFEYAAVPRQIDYAKYFAYAGLEVTATAAEGNGAYLGVHAQARDGRLVVVDASAGSPAERVGIKPGAWLVEVDGVKATVKSLSDALAAKKPGDRIKLRTASGAVEVEVGVTPQWTYAIRPAATAGAAERTILEEWLGR